MKSILKLSIYLASVLMLTAFVFAAPSAVDVIDSAQEVHYETVEELMDEGTESTPFVISSAEQFNYYANLIKNSNSAYADKYYVLSCNIDFEGKEIIPFGKLVKNDVDKDDGSQAFRGTLDGNGYALLNVSIPDTFCSGVVGYMTGGEIKNLSVEYKDMTSEKSYSSLKYFGGILGCAVVETGKTVTISDCETDGDIVLSCEGAIYAGGITGIIRSENGSTEVSDCVSHISFDVYTKKSGYMGGFSAYIKGGSSHTFEITNCVCYGDVSLVSSYLESTVGGFIGYANTDAAGWSGWASEDEAVVLADTVYHLDNCASLGNVNAKAVNKASAGGFVAIIGGEGDVNIRKCYIPSVLTIDLSAKETQENTSGIKTDVENLKDELFYSSSLGFDFTYKWYMSASELHLRTVAKSHGAATALEEASLRLSSYRNGLRFTAQIDMFKRDYCNEYGFIVASAESLGDQELTFDFYPCGSGAAFNDDDIDLFIDKTDETVTFTAVVYNVAPALYSKDIVARAYISYECDGETVILYGNPVKANISSTAAAFKNNNPAEYELLDDEDKKLLESMIGQ